MALILQKEWKGCTFEYWCITQKKWDKITNSTSVILSCFKDEATRREDLKNSILELNRNFLFQGDLTAEEIYPLIKTYVTSIIPSTVLEDITQVCEFQNAIDSI